MRNKAFTVSVVLGLLMVTASGLTKVMTPSQKMADTQPKFKLETLIPTQFGDWRIDPTLVPLAVDPDTQARLDAIYNQTLSRTYINRDGQRVMLSIAYGGDQSDNMGGHYPETCYTAQGFQVQHSAPGSVSTPYGAIPVKRLYAVSGQRHEPITYWITIGNRAAHPGMEQRLTRLRYGLTGMIADGMLVRVSTIGTDEPAAYGAQEQFINAMLGSLDERARTRLTGTLGM
ncbi:exosortase-associated protein EpsI, B-type [Duganella radicis]|uniref:EpsI family protein n=1 Tax=Duganella radicis TaxID=551988 RepID=A0A6L6PS91_9BURK|nr:exosortase-associated protein EpsI, B-type [Duganella radicis]MTV41910.1 EpsI family protein [Duganella radicis]